jgi:DnaJ-class molecular chaperone
MEQVMSTWPFKFGETRDWTRVEEMQKDGPVEVPADATCGACGGSGIYHGNRCGNCHGTGRIA